MKDIAGSITVNFIDGSKTVSKFNNSVFFDERNKPLTKFQVITNLTEAARTIAGVSYKDSEIQFID